MITPSHLVEAVAAGGPYDTLDDFACGRPLRMDARQSKSVRTNYEKNKETI
jgi:hypothetical protein